MVSLTSLVDHIYERGERERERGRIKDNRGTDKNFQGADCSKSVCPVLCSSHGQYGGGMCHCEDGWKGAECDIPLGDCQVPDCNQHGQCVRGSCVCNPGWKGGFCDERKLKTCLVITQCRYI